MKKKKLYGNPGSVRASSPLVFMN